MDSYLFAVIKGGKGLSFKIDVNPASNCIGNHKEGAGQVVRTGMGMDPALKVPKKHLITKKAAANQGDTCCQKGRQHRQDLLDQQHQQQVQVVDQSFQYRSCNHTCGSQNFSR